MPYTVEDFRREYAKEHFKDLTPAEQREAMKDLTPQDLLTVLSPEQIEQLRIILKTEPKSGQPKKRRRK
jgi:hypothetical protein